MEIRLYTLRYKTSRIQGVATGFVEVAANADPRVELAEATRKGEWYCAQEPNRRFIGVVSAVLVRLDEAGGPAKVAAAAPEPTAQADADKDAPDAGRARKSAAKS